MSPQQRTEEESLIIPKPDRPPTPMDAAPREIPSPAYGGLSWVSLATDQRTLILQPRGRQAVGTLM